MPDSDLTHLTADATHVGVNIARTIRVIAKLLSDWCAADKARKERDGAGDRTVGTPSYLTAIYFDKLATLYCRLWGGLHDDRQVRYGAGFVQRRGWHGPGQALRINRTEEDKIAMGRNPEDYRRHDWAFTTEVVEKLTPAIGKARGLFKLDRNAWDPACRVYPQLEGSVWDSWCFDCDTDKDEALFLDRKELALVSLISSAITDLSKAELRAIGTHCSADETCRDILFNLAQWGRDFDSALQAIGGKIVPNIEASIRRLVTVSREVQRKSIDNRSAYETAYSKFIKRISTQATLSEAFRAVQGGAGLIWQDSRVKKYAAVSSTLIAFGVYCRRVLSILGTIGGLGMKEVAEADGQLTDLTLWCKAKALAPFDYGQVASKTTSEVGTLLGSIGSKIRGEMPEEDA
jgi:hypothetical protein